MSRSLGSIDAPSDAPGPSEDVISEDYGGLLVIYDAGDAGWETRIQVPLHSPLAILDVQDHR